jgi:hypothetical protein
MGPFSRGTQQIKTAVNKTLRHSTSLFDHPAGKFPPLVEADGIDVVGLVTMTNLSG